MQPAHGNMALGEADVETVRLVGGKYPLLGSRGETMEKNLLKEGKRIGQNRVTGMDTSH